jgi:hypothetical protein
MPQFAQRPPAVAATKMHRQSGGAWWSSCSIYCEGDFFALAFLAGSSMRAAHPEVSAPACPTSSPQSLIG